MKQLYFAMVNFQRRADSMRSFFGYQLEYVPPLTRAKWTKPFGYVVQCARMLNLVLKEQPDIVWLQLPPTFLPHFFRLVRLVSPKKFKIAADCHNATFAEPWVKMPGLVGELNKMDLVVAHNAEVAKAAAALGVDPARLRVLETRPAQLQGVSAAEADARDGRPVIVIPCSFKADEPISIIAEAARLLPEARFVVTGGNRLSAEQLARYKAEAPANLEYAGYLATDAFNRLILSCSALVGLTTQEGIQLSVANEAVGAGRPMVLSDTRILRDLFGAAAVFCANTGQGLAEACREAIANGDELAARSRALRDAREARWQAQAREAGALIGLMP